MTTYPSHETHESGEILIVRIEAMAYGGKGIARVDGKVWFVQDGIDGDRLRVRVTGDNGRYGEAEIVEVLEPSAYRGAARCPYATACGGCQWMGVEYERQLEWKKSFVTSALSRIGKLGDDVAVEILPSPEVYGYRNRVLVRAHKPEDGDRLAVGYFARGSRNLVPVSRCEIAAEPINGVIAQLRALDVSDLPAFKARIELQDLPRSGVAVTVYPAEGPREAMDALVARIGKLAGIAWCGLVFALSEAPVLPFDEDLGLRFQTIPGQFQQVNVRHNHTLRRLVQAKVAAARPRRVLDVFCGSGNLTLPLADGTRYVEAVESNKKAIVCAHRNVEANGVRNVRFLAGDAEKHLWKCARGGERFDLVILDPPRQGMYQGMVPLKNLAPAHVVYVSCDPTTLARDLGYLCRKDAYRIERVVALDFFPNTYHVETVAFLARND